MLRRRALLSVAIFLAACSQPAGFQQSQIPHTLAGQWTLDSAAEIPPADWLPPVRSRHPRSAWRAMYKGPQPFRASIYELPIEASAFELMQRGVEPGAINFQHKHLYVVIEPNAKGTTVPQQAAMALDRALP